MSRGYGGVDVLTVTILQAHPAEGSRKRPPAVGAGFVATLGGASSREMNERRYLIIIGVGLVFFTRMHNCAAEAYGVVFGVEFILPGTIALQRSFKLGYG